MASTIDLTEPVTSPLLGADRVVRTLISHGVTLCLGNPGTSEMHLLAALDRAPALRPVLGLAESVVTGAADGYGRMAERPAVALLHTGPGLANGLSGLHNARRAPSPVLALVGDHARSHAALSPPLATDVVGLARPMSDWVGMIERPEDVGRMTGAALAAASQGAGQVATLILPTDIAWAGIGPDAAGDSQPRQPAPVPDAPPAALVDRALEALRRPGAMLLLGGSIDRQSLECAGRIAAATGACLAVETFPGRLPHGAGLPDVERLPYLPEALIARLAGLSALVLVGSRAPVTFFAYPGLPGDAVPGSAEVIALARPADRIGPALAALADALGSPPPAAARARAPLVQASGALDPLRLAQVVAARLPEAAILVDESISGGLALFPVLASAAPHDWLTITGGAIGWGLPAATGAALACPGRRVVAIVGDGSAIYAIPALWTMAREGLDVTVLILANRDYAILEMEYARVGRGTPGAVAGPMMHLDRPELDFVALARGFGVPAGRVATAEELDSQLARRLSEPGPALLELAMPRLGLSAMGR
jgi:acetolactate synthase-1/2/3 large subunit